MLEYKRSRTEFSDDSHDLAREVTEAINAFIKLSGKSLNLTGVLFS